MGILIGFLGLGKVVGAVGGFLARKGVVRGTLGRILGGARRPPTGPRVSPRPPPRGTSPRTRRTGARRSGQRGAPSGRPSSVSGAGARIVPRSRGAALRAPAMAAAVVGGGLVAPRVLRADPRSVRGPTGRAFARILPGGTTGALREVVPLTDRTDKVGRPIAIQAQEVGRTYCAPGYVAVTFPNGEKACVLRRVAISLGLWKARRKPPISAGQWSKLTGAATAEKKAKEVAQTAGWKVTRK